MTQLRLHAGQRRFHEFAKWREIVNQQQQLDQNNSGSPVRFYTTPLQQQQHRTFFFGSTKNSVTKYLRDLELKSLSAVSSQDPSDTQAHYRFLSELAKDYPQLVLQAVQSKQYALSPPIVTLYLRVLMQLQLYNQLDVDSLVSRLQANAADSEGLSPAALQEFARDLHAQKLSKKEQAQHALNFFSAAAAPAAHYGGSGIGGQAMGVLGSLGKNARQPIYVQLADKSSFRQQIVGGVLRFGLFVAVLSAVGAFVDEKGIGRGLGMNASKHIKEAEHDGRKVKFEDVKGVEEAKAELEEIVMYLKDPSKFTRLGGQLPRGLLLTGPPGTGKTLLAKAIAGEADVPFFYSSGSQFEEVYVGLGAKRIRELFEAAKKKAPAIIFIDEIDAVGGTRKLKDQSALKMTLNELLVQLDGFDENQGIIVIGATNFMESLDTALLRPGRFDKHVSVPLPDVGGRKEILEMYAKKTKLSTDVDLNVIARGTPGFSGADLFNLMNQASIKASIDGLEAIDMSSLEYSKDKIIMGPERKTAVITPQTAKSTAYHEAGHAVVAVMTAGNNPIHKATIMPRGRALGMVATLPEGDQTSMSKKQMSAFMDMAMGGRAAEELIFGEDEVTSGASSDIEQATKMARSMITQCGFSDEVGIVAATQDMSNATRGKIDAEVKRMTDASYKRAKDILQKYAFEHKLLAETLMEYETLSGDEVRDVVLRRKRPSRPSINKDGGARGDQSVLTAKSPITKPKSRIPGFGMYQSDE